MKKLLLLLTAHCLLLTAVFGQYPVVDAAAQVQRSSQHAEDLARWADAINKATEQVNKLNDMVTQLNDVQGLIGKGMGAIGIDPSIANAVDLARSVNRFGEAIQSVQFNAGRVSFDLEKLRQAATDPNAWGRYVTTSRSYESTQDAQRKYDEQAKRLQQERAKAQAQLNAAKSLGETAKAQAAIQAIDAAERALAEERKRAFEQQQANFIENRNQQDAWEQACRDWTMENAGNEANYSAFDRRHK